MPNYCDTNIILTGPDAEIERFKRTAFAVPPTDDDHNGIDMERAEWREPLGIVRSTYGLHEGRPWLWIRSANQMPLKVIAKISALYPELTFDLTASDGAGLLIKGSIKAGVADLHRHFQNYERRSGRS